MAEPVAIDPHKILIVDDDEDLLDILVEKFDSIGWNVSTASDGVEGLAKAEKIPFDVILSDIEMPRLNGIDFLSDIRSSDINSGCIAILMSGAFKQRDVDELKKYELGGFLEKPFSDEKLFDLLNRVIERRKEIHEKVSKHSDLGHKFKIVGED